MSGLGSFVYFLFFFAILGMILGSAGFLWGLFWLATHILIVIS